MTFLPIVERELRVASRRRATYWMRFLLALGAFGLWMFLLVEAPRLLPVSRGEMVFMAMSLLALGFCLLAGLFLTADSLSEERREGTLGLLFLTELKGYDVLFGKMIGTSVHAFYALLSVMPLLAYSVLVGGVTGGEFFRVSLALVTTLLLSLSAGMLVSARSQDNRQAMGATLLVLLIPTGLAPILGWLLGTLWKMPVFKALAWLSPTTLYWNSFDAPFRSPGGGSLYLASLLTVAGVSVGMLFLAARTVAAAWREKDDGTRETEAQVKRQGLRFGGPAFRSGRKHLLEKDPCFWLTSRDRLPRLMAWGALAGIFPLWLGCICGSLVRNGTVRGICFSLAVILAYCLHQALKWVIAIESSRRLGDDRRSGALELMLVTPVSIEAIIAGQRRALREMFSGPIRLTIATNAVLLVILIWVNPQRFSAQEVFVFCEVVLGGALMLLVDVYALSWVGMLMAFQTRRHNRAILATLGRVMLAPWLAVFVLVLLTIGGTRLSAYTALALSPLWFGLAAVIEHAFAARAKNELIEAFRQISVGADPRVFFTTVVAEPSPSR